MTTTCESQRVRLFGVWLDVVDMDQAVARLLSWIDDPRAVCRYVVTPNVDHLVLLQQQSGLRAAYRDADLVLADGHPVVWASRLLGQPLPQRVPGSDLVPALFAAATPQRRMRVYLLGAAPGVGQLAAERIRRQWPAVEVAGVYSPPLGFEKDAQENRAILQRVADTEPDVLVLGLGAPKQELWVQQQRCHLQARVVLCAGATIDFLAGRKTRAPRWLQGLGLEWLHRLLSEPRRLGGRYARDAWVFPQLVYQEWRQVAR